MVLELDHLAVDFFETCARARQRLGAVLRLIAGAASGVVAIEIRLPFI